MLPLARFALRARRPLSPHHSRHGSLVRAPLAAAALSAVALLAACAPDAPTALRGAPSASPSLDRAGYDVAGMHRQYGTPTKVGDGMARSYVVIDEKSHAPVELGIALDARTLDGLPSTAGEFSYLLPLPAQSPAPYRLVELDWNPQGHEPAGVYTFPHFDFHFYRITRAERDAILPSDPQFAAKANDVPTGAYVPPFYITPGLPSSIAVPRMGVHWVDVRSPELQNLLGNPAGYQQFTRTFIYGSWNGSFTFYEPMVTRAYLLSHPDATTPIPVPQLYPEAGYYPTSYRVSYDAQAKEYRIALSGLAARP